MLSSGTPSFTISESVAIVDNDETLFFLQVNQKKLQKNLVVKKIVPTFAVYYCGSTL